jgi:hypothetical protein
MAMPIKTPNSSCLPMFIRASFHLQNNLTWSLTITRRRYGLFTLRCQVIEVNDRIRLCPETDLARIGEGVVFYFK